MLIKLLKYEFKATARVYGGMYLALLAVAGLLGFGIHRQDLGGLRSGELFFELMFVLYSVLVLALVVVTVITVIQRFTKNLLGREGYLMHTLPVTESELVASKFLSSAVWLLVSAVVGTVSLGIVVVLSTDLGAIDWSGFWKDVAELKRSMEFNILGTVVWTGLLCYARVLCTILCIYAACMVGHLVPSHPGIVSVAAFFFLSWAQGKLETLLDAGGMVRILMGPTAGNVSGMVWLEGGTGTFFAVSFAITAAFGVVYFLLTTWLMKKKLNLND